MYTNKQFFIPFTLVPNVNTFLTVKHASLFKKSTGNSGNLAGLTTVLPVSQQSALSFTPNMSRQHILPLLCFHNLLTQSVSFWSYQHLFLSMYRRKVMAMSAYIVQLKSKAGVTSVNAVFTYLCLLHIDTTVAWLSICGYQIENMSSWRLTWWKVLSFCQFCLFIYFHQNHILFPSHFFRLSCYSQLEGGGEWNPMKCWPSSLLWNQKENKIEWHSATPCVHSASFSIILPTPQPPPGWPLLFMPLRFRLTNNTLKK